MNAVVLKAGEGHALRLGDVHMLVKEDGTHTRNALGLAEFEMAPHGHQAPLPHIHHTHDGNSAGGQGAFVMVPTGVAHTFSNPTERPARFLSTFTPQRYLSYFEELSQLSQATASPSQQQLAELMARYDTEVIS